MFQMNASGVIESPSVINMEEQKVERRRVAAVAGPGSDKYARLSESRSVTPSPPLGKTASSLRPRLLDLNAPSSLSPICSSGESTPHGTPSPRPVRRLAGFLRGGRGSNRPQPHITPTPNSITPSPGEMKPIFEAESPDELALVDAAFTYNCRLLKRTPQHVTVNVPGMKILVRHINKLKSNQL